MLTEVSIIRSSLVREGVLPWETKKVSGPTDVAKLARAFIPEDDPREHFICITLDAQNVVTGIATISIGTLNSSLVAPREVFRVALLHGAASIIVAHNHPSGDTTPSPDDIEVTHQLCQAGKLIGIPVMDHVIVGADEAWISLLEQGNTIGG